MSNLSTMHFYDFVYNDDFVCDLTYKNHDTYYNMDTYEYNNEYNNTCNTAFSGDFLLPNPASSTMIGSSNPGHKMHLDPLISFDPSSTLLSATSPISSPGLMSPPSTANTQVESHIFQFPTTSQASNIKSEDWSEVAVPCLQDTPTSTFPPGPIGGSSQGSPMAISPEMSTLNTPRGSITSMRSQNSPMNTDTSMGASLAPPPQLNPIPAPASDPMMSTNESDMSAFVSYGPMTHQNFPSPPGSPQVSSTTNLGAAAHAPPPPSYEDYYVSEMMPVPPPMFMKTEEVPSPPVFPNVSSVMTNYGSTPDPSESFVSSDTCPETPDSSVKEEGDVNSPDTGSYICLWENCHDEFVTQKALVEHISDSHMNSQKGCEEFPCLWKVRSTCLNLKRDLMTFFIIQDCSRKSKAFNAKYKLITHMRVHTKEKPYLCLVRLFIILEQAKPSS